jgi:hypothetical protein
MNTPVSLKETRFVGAYTFDGYMTDEVDDCARGVQNHVVGMKAGVVGFEKNLVVHAR